MAKRVNNIAYKGINHSPSLVSDNDGHASECVNLSPDYNDLKPMPMPVKNTNYQIEMGYSLFFVHQGIGYENYVEIDDTHTRLVFKDAEGNYLYDSADTPPYWSNESEAEILAIEAMGNTVIVSTKEGVEYIIFQPDVPVTGQTSGGSYKPIGQRPPMPVIEFMMKKDNTKYYELHVNEEQIPAILYESDPTKLIIGKTGERAISPFLKEIVAKIEKEVSDDNKFFQPFYVRFAYSLKTGDYILQSQPVLMLPSTDKCPIETIVSATLIEQAAYNITAIQANVTAAKLCYKIKNNVDLSDWVDIIDRVEIFISDKISNYEADVRLGADYYNSTDSYVVYRIDVSSQDFGKAYLNGIINTLPYPWPFDQFPYGGTNQFHYPIKSVDSKYFHKKAQDISLFYKISSIDINELRQMDNYEELAIENETLSNLATLPTLEDDYFTHNAVSPLLMQVYNSRLNMANISQKVFKGFVNGMQPQSVDKYWHIDYAGGQTRIYVDYVLYKVKKNGKTYIVTPYNDEEKLDYTTYLYYPDPDCYEVVVKFARRSGGSMVYATAYQTIPMKRHEYLNGSYWYDDMKCLGQYISESDPSEWSVTPPTLSENLWCDIPNRFMMSSVGNPWHFPIGNQFDIGRREIRALSLNAENMNAPQFGQNPIYVFSADGIWTIAINADGTFNKLSYVSGDVVSEMAAIGNSPTAAGAQMVFFKTSRGISAIVGSAVKEIDLVMKGRLFNPRTMLLPQGSIVDGVPTSGVDSYWLDLIYNSCDNLPYADFAKESNLLYDYRNNRLLLYHRDVAYMYVYDIRHDFWSKMLPMVIDESETSPAEQEYNTRGGIVTVTTFIGTAMVGNNAILTDTDGYLWNVGGQPDENDISGHHYGLYVSRPLRFGTDDMKTLSRIVHDQQLGSDGEAVKMALYGSRNGKDYYQVKTLRGTAYKFYIIVLYTKMLASSRYAYTAFEWEARMTDKIR